MIRPTPPPAARDQNSTAYLIEKVFIDSVKRNCSIEHCDHFDSDAANGWPLVSVKAVLAEEDHHLIAFNGEPCEIYNTYIVAEYPISTVEAGQPVSAVRLDKLAHSIRLAIRRAGETDAIEAFSYFEIEPLASGDRDIEEDARETPTRRVDICSFEAIVIRG